MKIQTILTTIDGSKLGFCQFHEHLFISKGVSFEINPSLFIDNLNKTLEEVNRYYLAGGRSIIDAQPVGCNRDTLNLVKTAQSTSAHILASTGFHKMCFYPKNHWIFELNENDIYQIYYDELTKGMYVDCDFDSPKKQISNKASIIKVALDSVNLTPQYLKVFRAAAKAQIETNVPMMIHVESNSDPLLLLDFLLDQGISANKLVFAHLDRACNDISTLLKILDKGCYVEFDTIGRIKYHSDEKEIELIRNVIESGHSKQLLCALDTTRERLKSYNPDGVGLDYILNKFIPLLKEKNIQELEIHRIFITNPITILQKE